MTPSIPAPYVAGTVTVTAGAPRNLLQLIQQQLAPNCPGGVSELMIAPDSGNVAPILVGAASAIAGPLTTTNYAYSMAATSAPRFYRATYPGANAPLGELQVLGVGALHVEVIA